MNFPGTRRTSGDLNPAGGARRDAEGSRIGIISAGNFPGGGTFPGDTPADVKVDYVRITPDQEAECPEEDVTPPATTATLDPALPGAGGTYDQDVTVNLDATDGGEFASGVDVTEFSVDGGVWQGGRLGRRDRGRRAHASATAPRTTTATSRSPRRVAFTIDKPNVVIKDIYAGGTTWNPDAITVPYGETVTWHWEEGSGQPHNVGLIAPDADPQQPNGGFVLISDPVEPPGSDPDLLHLPQGGSVGVRLPAALVVQRRRRASGPAWSARSTSRRTPTRHGRARHDGRAQPGAARAGRDLHGDVTVTLTAEDADDAFPSGVAKTEYRVDGGAWADLVELGERGDVRDVVQGDGRGRAPRRVPLDGRRGQRRGDAVGRLHDRQGGTSPATCRRQSAAVATRRAAIRPAATRRRRSRPT